MAGGSAGKISAVFVDWAPAHRALASRRTKGLATGLVDPHYRNGLYQIAYNGLAVATAGEFTRWFLSYRERQWHHHTM